MKPTMKAGMIVLIFALSCTKENSVKQTSVTAQTSSKATAASHFLGEAYGGGIIYWIDSATGSGLIAATENQHSGIAWNKDGSYKIAGAKGKGIGTGRKNTQKIITAFG